MVGVVVEALGAHVSIDVNGLPPTDRAHVGALWAGAAAGGYPETGVDRTVELRPAFEFRTTLAHLSGQVTVAAMSARRGDAWLLHAAAAADGAGRVVALVGPSGAGKTTAIRTLTRHYGYVSDESIAVEADGAVRAYRKPLSIVEAGTREKLQVSPAQAGLRSLPETPLRLAGLVVLDRRVDPTSPRLERLEPPSALTALAAQSSHAREMGRPLATMAGHLAVTGGAHRLVYSDAADLPEAIAPLFREPSGTPDTQDWDSVPALTGGGALRRSEVIDAIRYADGRVAILCDGARERDPLALHVLSADAGAAWWHPESHEESRDGDLISALVHHGLLARREE